MKPAVLVSVGLVAVVVVAAVIVIGGGSPESGILPAAPTTAASPATPIAPTVAPPGAVTTAAGDATAAFEAWAAPLRAGGLAVSAAGALREGDTILAAGLVIADPSVEPRWRWSIGSAALEGAAETRATLVPRGSQTLTLVDDAGTATTLAVTADTMTVAIDRDATGRATGVALEATGLTIGRENTTDPVRLGSVTFRIVLAPGDGAVPAATTGSIRLADIVTSAAEATPLGTEIDLVAAEFALDAAIPGFALGEVVAALQAPGGLRLSSVEVQWGVLSATGTGTLRLDANRRPEGTLALAVSDPLTVLDAFQAARMLDRSVLPDVYAAILTEMGDRPEAVPAFTIDLAGGEIVVRGAPRETGDLIVGTLAPLL